MSQVFILAIALTSIVLLALQPNKDGHQDKIINQLSTRLDYVNNIVASIEMQTNESILLESGVCHVKIQNFAVMQTNDILVKYKLYYNPIKSYIIFDNTSFIPFPSYEYSYEYGSYCALNRDYDNMLQFKFYACTTDLTGQNFTIARINNVYWQYWGSILKSEQQKFNVQNNTDLRFVASEDQDQCSEDQIDFYSDYTTPYQITGTSIYPKTNVIYFSIFLKNETTGFSLSAPIMIFLPFQNMIIK